MPRPPPPAEVQVFFLLARESHFLFFFILRNTSALGSVKFHGSDNRPTHREGAAGTARPGIFETHPHFSSVHLLLATSDRRRSSIIQVKVVFQCCCKACVDTRAREPACGDCSAKTSASRRGRSIFLLSERITLSFLLQPHTPM
jgi:hypothetical protein